MEYSNTPDGVDGAFPGAARRQFSQPRLAIIKSVDVDKGIVTVEYLEGHTIDDIPLAQPYIGPFGRIGMVPEIGAICAVITTMDRTSVIVAYLPADFEVMTKGGELGLARKMRPGEMVITGGLGEIFFDAEGNVFIADKTGNAIKLDADGGIIELTATEKVLIKALVDLDGNLVSNMAHPIKITDGATQGWADARVALLASIFGLAGTIPGIPALTDDLLDILGLEEAPPVPSLPGIPGPQGSQGLQGNPGIRGSDGAAGATGIGMEDSGMPMGFEDITDSTLTWVDGTLTFTITPIGISFDVWVQATKYTKGASESLIGDGTDFTIAEGLWYISYDNTGSLVASQSVWDLSQVAPIALFYWDDTNSTAITFLDERHGIAMDWATHLRLHFIDGTQYESGMALGDISADASGGLDSSAQCSVADGIFDDEDIRITVTDGSPQDISPILQAPVFYLEGATPVWRVATANNFPVLPFSGGSNRLAYNQFTGGSWQQTEVTDNSFVLAHVFAINDSNEPIIAIQGQNVYSDITAARDGATVELSSLITTGLPTIEWTPLGTLIYQTSNSYSNSVKARVRTTAAGDDYIDWRGEGVSPSTAPNSHNNLSNRDAAGAHPADTVDTDITNFDGHLSSADTDVQLALDTLDELTIRTPFTFQFSGNLPAVTTDIAPGYALPAGTIKEVNVYRRLNGSSGSTIIDVNLNGTTIYTTQANRPTINSTDGDDATVISTNMEVTAVTAGDHLQADLDQKEVGGGVNAPRDLNITVLMELS